MIKQSARIVAGLGFCLMACIQAGMAPPVSASETEWQENLGGKARIISSGPIDPETLAVDLAVQIELKQGWKTYWRTPGDSGIPPDFDFSKSSNLKEYKIMWPAPKSFQDDYGYSIGYKHGVILPVRAVAKNRILPMVVDLTVRYGVCERICVPVENKFSLVVTRSSRAHEASAVLIKKASESVPAPIADGAPFSVTHVARDAATEAGNLVVTARVEGPSDKTELFIEGPKNWYFPLPKKTSETDGVIKWSISLADVPKTDALSGNYVTFTLVNGKQAVEQVWHLD